MKSNDRLIIILSIFLGVFLILVGNIEQYAETQEFYSMGGLIFILYPGAYYLAIREENI